MNPPDVQARRELSSHFIERCPESTSESGVQHTLAFAQHSRYVVINLKFQHIILAGGFGFASAATAQAPHLVVAPARPEPGAIVRLTLSAPATGSDRVTAVHGTLAGEPLHFIAAGGDEWHAIGGVPVDSEGSLVASAVIAHASGKIETARVRFTLPKLPPPVAQPLAVDSSFTRPDPAVEARIARENARARAIGEHAHDRPPMWTAPFIRPRTSIITSPFGSGRLFNDRLTTRHLGVDFRGGTGDPIRAANRGVVALVANFFLAGNVVYVDHGGGIVTAYFHMSKPLVKAGDTVSRGQIIGLIGATGRVTGPHLHWAARYGAITVNPLDLVTLGATWYGRSTTRSSTQHQLRTRNNQHQR
jgi:Peptidase family M23